MLFSSKRGRPLVVFEAQVVSVIRFPVFLLLLVLIFPLTLASIYSSLPSLCWLSLFGIATPLSEPVAPFVAAAVAPIAAVLAAAKGQDVVVAVAGMGG